jgi:hypothetical protein
MSSMVMFVSAARARGVRNARRERTAVARRGVPRKSMTGANQVDDGGQAVNEGRIERVWEKSKEEAVA